MPRESEHVFVDAHGKPYNGSSVTRKLERIIRKCGLSEKIHFHSLRHTYASWLVRLATPLAEIQKLLGHSSIVTTQIYSHSEEEHLRGAAERIRLDEFTPKGLLSRGCSLTRNGYKPVSGSGFLHPLPAKVRTRLFSDQSIPLLAG